MRAKRPLPFTPATGGQVIASSAHDAGNKVVSLKCALFHQRLRQTWVEKGKNMAKTYYVKTG